MDHEHLDVWAENQPDPLATAAIVSRVSGIPLGGILGHDRHAPIARARHVAIWATRQQADMSYPELGQLFGKRNHKTAMHSCQVVTDALGGGGEIAVLAERVRNELIANGSGTTF